MGSYDQRGASGKVLEVQDNDLNRRCMPHSSPEQNMV